MIPVVDVVVLVVGVVTGNVCCKHTGMNFFLKDGGEAPGNTNNDNIDDVGRNNN